MNEPRGTRRLSYPDYSVEVIEGDLSLKFKVPTSRFGPVEIVLAYDDAEAFFGLIDKTLEKSLAEMSA